MARRTCFSFEASGHRYRPLDGIAGVVMRLLCPRCGRVIPADQAFNTLMWEGVDLPADDQVKVEAVNRDLVVH